jgi:hypothetical protein
MISGRSAIVAVMWAALTGALCCVLATALSAAGVFEYVDVLFDTDVAWFLQGFSEGRGTGTGWGARSLVHPNVANFVNPPVRALAATCAAISVCAEPAQARLTLAMWVSPTAAAFETYLLFLAIRVVSGSDARASLVALMNLVLLPTLVYGALPESFALTGSAFAAFFYLVSRTAAGRPVHAAWWLVVGTAVASITLTNIWLFALGYTVTQARDRGLTVSAVLAAARLAAGSLAATAALALVFGAAYDALSEYRTELQQFRELRAPRERVAERQWPAVIPETIGLAVSGAFMSFPKALGDTVLPPRPSIQGPALGLDTTRGTIGARAEPSLQVNFRNTSADWGTLLALVAVVGAAGAAVMSRGPQRLVYQVAMALIAANWIFHSVFGIELFLYAKHWSVAVAVLLAAWLDLKRPGPHAGTIVFVLLIVVAAWRDVSVFQHMFRSLPGS